jgi:hypothetical protein
MGNSLCIICENKQQMLARVQGKWDPHELLVGRQISSATTEISMETPQDIKSVATLRPSIPLLGMYLMNLSAHNKDTCTSMFIAALFIFAKL